MEKENCNACLEPYHCDCKCDTCIRSKMYYQLGLYCLRFKDLGYPMTFSIDEAKRIVDRAFVDYKERNP